MASFNMQCPYCNTTVSAEEEWIGMACNCPNCNNQITISAPVQIAQPQFQQQYQQPQQQFQQQYQQPHPQFQQGPYGQSGMYNNFTPPQQGKSFIVYLLLGLFLGNLGIHDYYAGYNNNGTIKLLLTLLTCGALAVVSGIWALIDICTVRQDANGNPFV